LPAYSHGHKATPEIPEKEVISDQIAARIGTVVIDDTDHGHYAAARHFGQCNTEPSLSAGTRRP
jgi:hypothetical protein